MGSGLAIKHDAVDNILGKTTEHGECYYQYDALDRLIQADNPGEKIGVREQLFLILEKIIL